MRIFSAVVIISIMLIIALGCSRSTSPVVETTHESDSLPISVEFSNYVIEQSRTCFCPMMAESVRLTVVRNEIVDITVIYDDRRLPADQWHWYKTFDELDEFIEEAQQRNPDQILVEYNPTHNHPTKIWIDYNTEIAHEEMGYITHLVTYES